MSIFQRLHVTSLPSFRPCVEEPARMILKGPYQNDFIRMCFLASLKAGMTLVKGARLTNYIGLSLDVISISTERVNHYRVQYISHIDIHMNIGWSGWSNDPVECHILEHGFCDCILD